jgi:hypothetical protein
MDLTSLSHQFRPYTKEAEIVHIAYMWKACCLVTGLEDGKVVITDFTTSLNRLGQTDQPLVSTVLHCPSVTANCGATVLLL